MACCVQGLQVALASAEVRANIRLEKELQAVARALLRNQNQVG